MERRLEKQPELREHYVNFLTEYEKLGHMSKVNVQIDSDDENIYNYLPHHAVVKDTSSTTKVRVVFDASCKTSSGLSLNEVLKVGPKVQNDLFDILVRMRKHQIVIVADVEKMYRMVNIHPSHRDLQRIVWRSDPSEEMSHYTLNTVTYGTASASFLATRTLNEIGIRAKDKYPEASEVILNDFYIDDLISGSDSLENTIKLKGDVTDILLRSKFKLRKWMSNDISIFENDNPKSNDSSYQIKVGQETKTLGVNWNPETDSLHYTFNYAWYRERVTKRLILSSLAQLFDPLGLVNPCIIQAKLILQQLWQTKIDWDQTVPDCIEVEWFSFISNIHFFNALKIARCVIITEAINCTIHGFCDASQRAYGACIYICSQNGQGKIISHLVCAKSRLAPIKAITLPRLELCGALLLAQLMSKALQAMRMEFVSINFWTDSMIVLAWLNVEPNRWKIFVSNRVAEIQNLTENGIWRHVESKSNPADIISRGCNPQTIKDEVLWWHGPAFLTENKIHWPQDTVVNITNIPEARKENLTLSFAILSDSGMFQSFSSFSKLLRVTAYVLRYIHNSRARDRISGFLTSNELDDAKIKICKIVQCESFSQEIACLRKSQAIMKHSKLLTLNPFLDSDGLVRVGGRLLNSNLTYDQKYPIVLPSKHIVTRLIINHFHHKYLHAGAQFLLSQIRTQFWPINGRNEIRSMLRRCITCFRIKPSMITQLMSELPAPRVIPSRPFTYVGIDYAGPYLLKDGKTRNRNLISSYLCIFVCLSTKAVHVELVTALTADAFLNALKRFTSRRGLCRRIYSDNAKNFVGANNYLKQMHDLIKNVAKTDKLNNDCIEKRVEWHFIPARSPHFGGIWEAAVKSFKYHLKRVVGNNHFNFEEFYTILTQIEAILNSRPILPLSNDPNDFSALTPGHFLIGSRLIAVPQDTIPEVPFNRLTYFKQLQQMVQHFWKAWSRDYLHTLQQRAKWCENHDNIKVGALVLLKEENVPPLQWKLGRVVSVHPGPDNRVRVVSVLSNDTVFKRAITKICPLPIND